MSIQTLSIPYVHDGRQLEGFMAWDDAFAGPRPGVLVSHAWAGRSPFENGRAKELAALGYTGFALDLFGKGVLGRSPEENQALMAPFKQDRIMLQSRLQESLRVLAAQEIVDSTRLAIIGYCFGGLCALDLARSGADIRAAVSIHGLLDAPGNTADVKAKVLALHGWDDPLAPPSHVMDFTAEMSAAGVDWQLHAYGNTLHAFTNPQADDPDSGKLYSPDADRRSWMAIRNFLAETLA